MSTATLRDTLDTVFTDGDWLLDIAFCVGNENTPDDLDGYVHYLTLKRRTPRLTPAAEPILLTTEDDTLQYTAPNLVGPRVRTPQLGTWDDGVYDVEQSWLRPDGITEVVLVTTVTVIKGLSLGGSFAGLPLPSVGPSITVVRSPSQARVVRTARGPSGWNGWTAVLSVDDVTDPPRRLMQVIDWAGGGGEKPTVGGWASPGGFTEDPEEATDFGGTSTAATLAATAAAVAATAAANTAEASRATAETSRVGAEAARVTADAGRTTAETSRVGAEAGRVTAETARVGAEAARVTADAGRTTAETSRVGAEAGRVTAETARVGAEAARVTADAGRTTAETSRVGAEAGRVTAETSRVAAEAARVTASATAVANANAAAAGTNLIVAAAVDALEGATGQEIVSVSAPRYLTAADHGKLLAFVGSAPALLYVPAGLPGGFQAEVMKGAAGNVYVHALPGAAVGGVAGKTGLTTQYASEMLRQISPNNYAVTDGESATAPPSINFPDHRNARASGLALLSFA